MGAAGAGKSFYIRKMAVTEWQGDYVHIPISVEDGLVATLLATSPLAQRELSGKSVGRYHSPLGKNAIE
jgi:hypothetical protein